MTTKCEVKFDQNPEGVYYSGQVASGKVHLTLSKTKSVKGIYLQISGFSKVLWHEHHVRGHRRFRKNEVSHFTGREDYLSTTSYLVGSEEATLTELHPGIYTYNFSCVLPNSAPSSFEGTHGSIRYLAKVVLIKPGEANEIFTVGFTVVKALDLNYDSPLLTVPMHAETAKKYWWCLCWSKPLSLSIDLPQTGFVPGQYIPITLTVTNDSFINIHAVHFSLRKIVSYHSQTPPDISKQETFLVSKKSTGKIEKYNSRVIQEYIYVPALPPTSVNLCKIVKINYDISIEAEINGFHLNPSLQCPVTIGTVPFADVIQQQPQSSIRHSEPQRRMSELSCIPVFAPIRNSEPFTLPLNIQPPSYEEATHIEKATLTDEDDATIGDTKFIPKYPVYNYQNPTAPEAGMPSTSFGESSRSIPLTEL